MRTGPSILREALTPLQCLELRRSPVLDGAGVPAGRGSAVVLVPGFMCSDRLLAPMRGWLRRVGYRSHGAGIGRNTGCAEHEVGRLQRSVERLVETEGRPVSLLGYSRGGSFVRVLAARRPELVNGIVTLGTPSLDPRCVHLAVAGPTIAITALGSLGVPGLLRLQCFTGACCAEFREDLQRPLEPSVGYVAIRSDRDGVVDHRYTPDAGAQHVEVDSTHAGYLANPRVLLAVAHALRSFGEPSTPSTTTTTKRARGARA